MYGITNCGKLFADELPNCLIYEAGFNQSKCQMSIYYKYAPYNFKFFVLSYVDELLYWYKSVELGNCLVDTLGNRLHVNFLGYAHCFISISTSQLKDHSISVDQARYDTCVVANNLDTSTMR